MCVHRANSAHSLCDIGNIFWGFPSFWAAPTPVSARLKYAYCEICSVISFSSPGQTRPKGEKRIARFDLTRASLSLLQSVSSTCCLYGQKERERQRRLLSLLHFGRLHPPLSIGRRKRDQCWGGKKGEREKHLLPFDPLHWPIICCVNLVPPFALAVTSLGYHNCALYRVLWIHGPAFNVP